MRSLLPSIPYPPCASHGQDQGEASEAYLGMGAKCMDHQKCTDQEKEYFHAVWFDILLIIYFCINFQFLNGDIKFDLSGLLSSWMPLAFCPMGKSLDLSP